MLQQCILGFRFPIFQDRNHHERHIERTARNALEVRMIADHPYDVAVKLAKNDGRLSRSIMQCGSRDAIMTTRSRLAASKRCHLSRSHGSNEGHRRVEILRELADRPAEALEVDSPEEVSVFIVGVLVGRDNIAAQGK